MKLEIKPANLAINKNLLNVKICVYILLSYKRPGVFLNYKSCYFCLI